MLNGEHLPSARRFQTKKNCDKSVRGLDLYRRRRPATVLPQVRPGVRGEKKSDLIEGDFGRVLDYIAILHIRWVVGTTIPVRIIRESELFVGRIVPM